jgi:hypothetical protein
MRYTLRLLTKDQFRRAARLICALELLRQRYHDLGTEPISIGLWVGGSVSPNRFDEAERARAEALRRTDDEGQIAPPSLLVLEQCPWCGTPFRSPENLDTGAEHFRFRCLHPGCEFGATPERTLPCQVVDEALYRQPPTLLLATVDKFARLAWEERATVFFGTPPNRPPELIIQDELHLIAGALGSVAGLYEAALETVLTLRGVHPKYIASTATIRMAADQVRRLFGRDAAVFPPPGLDSEDSYFARTVPLRERPGRLYVGYLAPARARQHCLAPLAGALLGAPEVLFEAAPAADRQTLRDAWWTVLVYHGSLKGISVSLNAQQDIETVWGRLQVEVQQARTHGSAAGGQTGLPPWERRNNLRERTTQMTSQMSADDNARSFERLGKSCDHVEALDLALATNMISVGLDVGRLAVMVVNGQPLTTAEYIQASSRVGRGEVPGIVVANYYRSQARSLSHYEDFRAYHESFYRFVEPTSITPYTWQARKRALHAALVIVVRHGCLDLAANDKAGAFDPARPELAKAIQALTLRCRRADPGRGAETGAHLAELVNQWHDLAKAAPTRPARLVYTCARGIHNDLCLLCSHDDEVQGLWPTLNSMRNVEHTALVRIL